MPGLTGTQKKVSNDVDSNDRDRRVRHRTCVCSCRQRRTRSSPPRRFPIRPRASATTSKPRARCGTRRRISRSPASSSAQRARRSMRSTDLGIQRKRIGELRFVLRPGRKHKFRINYLPMTLQRRVDGASRLHVQRPSLRRQPAGHVRLVVEDMAAGLRVRLPLSRSLVCRVRHAGEADRRAGEPAGADRHATSCARRRRFRTSAASRASMSRRISPITGELVGHQDSREHQRRLPGALLRLRPVRHGELQRLRRRADRISQPRRRLHLRERPGRLQDEGDLLRWGRRY